MIQKRIILTEEIRKDNYPAGHPWSIRVKDNFWNQSVVITQGGYGARPIFVTHNTEDMIVGTEFAGIVSRMDSLTPSPEGRMELLLYGHTSGEKTLFSEIERLPPGDRHTVSTEKIHSEWMDRITDYGTSDLKDTADIFIQMFQNRTHHESAGWLPLTGGVDSRTIASTLISSPGIRAYTRGDTTHPEVVCAAKIAQMLRLNHYPMPYSPQYLEHHYTKVVELTGGLVSLDHSHAIHPLEHLKRLSTGIAIPGSNGEYGRAFWSTKQESASGQTPEQIAENLFEGETGKTINRYSGLFTPEAAPVIESCRATYRERYCETAECARYSHPVAWNDEFYLRNRLRTFSVFGPVIWGSFFTLEIPFLEYDYVQSVRALPPKLRTGPKLHGEIIRRTNPKLLSIPLYPGGVRLQEQPLGMLLNGLRNRLQGRRGHKSVQNYATWLRDEKAFIGPFLQQAHRSFCGLVDGETVTRLWKEHLAGADHHRLLCRLLTPVMADAVFEKIRGEKTNES
jgi:hypothetical protein